MDYFATLILREQLTETFQKRYIKDLRNSLRASTVYWWTTLRITALNDKQ